MKYDYIIVGAGLFGSVFAHEAKKRGNKCLVIDKRSHIGGNIYTEDRDGINVHMYGAHIFHTDNEEIWNYINRFSSFNNYINAPLAYYKGEIYNLPFNMNTFNKLWGVVTPEEAKKKISEQIISLKVNKPKNLEEQAVSLVGKDIYERFIKGYTEKQWGRKAAELPAFIIRRLPLRFRYDNNYYNDRFQGIPMGGYTKIIEKMLEGIPVELNTDYFAKRRQIYNDAGKLVFTGMIDEYFDYKHGILEYRSLRFQHEQPDTDDYQGNAVINYTDAGIPYTRIIEHKHFEFGNQPYTFITKEYPEEWKQGYEPYYPVNNDRNNKIHTKYADLAEREKKVLFGGRLGYYKYLDMDKVIISALQMVDTEFGGGTNYDDKHVYGFSHESKRYSI